MKKLPIGIQTFAKIIEDDYLYIDKTKAIFNIIQEGEVYFFSRPRRFGKSLLVSTLKEIFSGNQELFKGLYIYDKIKWKKYPIIRFDFSFITYSKSIEIFEESLGRVLQDHAEEYGVALTAGNIRDRFKELIRKLSSINQVVILVDEYDKPIIDFMDEPETAKRNRKVLREFYSVLKGADEYLRFVFLTGVTKFSKVSIFSGLNNIRDITLSEEFATLPGITKEEMKHAFKDRIPQLCAKENLSEKELFDKIKRWYNGYSWNGVDRVYNPTSLLYLFEEKKFGTFWFSTGTPTFLIETIRKYQYEIPSLEKIKMYDFALDSYDVDQLDVNALLFQAGYLTIQEAAKKRESIIYTLSCPNYEVKHALIHYIMADFIQKPVSTITPLYIDLLDALEEKKIDHFIIILKSIFAKIPYTLHLPEEAYYHSLFYLLLTLLGAKIDLEVLTDKGRIDAILELDDCIYVIEFKRGSAEEAVKQIENKKYYESYLNSGKEVFLLGVGGFDEKDIKYICREVK